MSAQPFYHAANILFTTKGYEVTPDDLTRLLREALIKHAGLARAFGIVINSVECEDVACEPGDPSDLYDAVPP